MRLMRWGGVAVAALGLACAEPQYDIVLAGGRVMDPESGLDAVRHVGIRGDRIAALSERPLQGATVVDVSGLVVTAGFVDLHAHGQNPSDNAWQVRDGVTTALELEGGAWPVAKWYAAREGKALVHYGATSSHPGARVAVTYGTDDPGSLLNRPPEPRPAWSHEPLSPAGVGDLLARVRQGIDEGALGVGMGIHYTPGATLGEIHDVFAVAAEKRVPVYVHVRGAGMLEPGGSVSAVQEVIANATSTGASLHVVHLGSSGLGQAMFLARMIDGVRARGIDVTTEVYPYTAASTDIASAIFDPGWQERLGIGYDAIQWPPTNERLTAATFARFRAQGGPIIIHLIPEAMVDSLVAHPGVMIASDGVPIVNGRGHPRGVGTYARILGRYVRERSALGLMEALRKMSYLPAERVRGAAPSMARKGRIRVGADADITVFDPDRVIDRATFEDPAQASEGIPHVLVAGVFVVRDGRLVEGVAPGRAVRREAP